MFKLVIIPGPSQPRNQAKPDHSTRTASGRDTQGNGGAGSTPLPRMSISQFRSDLPTKAQMLYEVSYPRPDPTTQPGKPVTRPERHLGEAHKEMEEQAQLHFPVCLSPSSAPTSQPRAIYKRLVTSKKQKSSPLSQAQPYHATRPSLITRPERHLGETHRKTKEQAQLHFPESVSQFRPYLPSNGPARS